MLQADYQGLLQGLRAGAPTDCPTPSYDCALCRDTGWLEVGERTVAPCRCQEVKRARRRIEESGLSRLMATMTFERFQAAEPWQQRALGVVRRWLEEGDAERRPWLFVGGAVGSGKTHLCTAACGELLRAGRAVRYMLWPEEARALKACVNDGPAFDALIHPLQRVPVLYIDDLFKVQRALGGPASVTPAEVRVAFELIDARYRTDRPTIISCEWLMDELLQMDEGVFSRVYEKSRGFIAQIGREDGRNMRIRGAEAPPPPVADAGGRRPNEAQSSASAGEAERQCRIEEVDMA